MKFSAGFSCSLLMRYQFLLVTILALFGCGGGGGKSTGSGNEVTHSNGSAVLYSNSGESRSFSGALVEVFGLGQSSLMVGKRTLTLGSAYAGDQGKVSIPLHATTLRDEKLYVVEFRCPIDVGNSECNVNMPIHVVLSGGQLKAGDWKATILTELVYQKIAYYAQAHYSESEMQQVLDAIARWLLTTNAESGEKNYNDLLQWDPALANASEHLLRSDILNEMNDLWDAIRYSDDEIISLAEENMYKSVINAKIQGIVSPYVGTVNTKDKVRSISSSGNYVYVALGSGGMEVLDVSTLKAPKRIGGVDTPGFASSIVVLGNYAYVADGGAGLQIIDISSPENPYLVGALNTTGNASSLSVSGDYVYLVDGEKGLRIIDVRDPSAPFQAARLDTQDIAQSVAVSGDFAFVANGKSGLLVVDVSNPMRPFSVRLLSTGGAAIAVAVSEGRAIVSTDARKVLLIDCKTPEESIVIGKLGTDGLVKAISIAGNRMFLSAPLCSADNCIATYSLLHMVDISNPFSPMLIESLGVSGSASALLVRGDYVYVANDPGATIWDASPWDPPANFFEGGIGLFTGLQVVDVRRPSPAPLVSNLAMSGLNGVLAIQADYAYLGNDEGIKIIDVHDPGNLRLVGSTDTPLPLLSLVLGEGFAYGATTQGLYVFDTSDPLRPILIGSVGLPNAAGGIAVSGQYVFATSINGLCVVNIADPWSPVVELERTESLIGYSPYIAVLGNTAYLANIFGGLLAVDVSNPLLPELKGYLPDLQFVLSADVHNESIYMASMFFGLQIVDTSNPLKPVLAGAAPLPRFSALALDYSAGYVYVVGFNDMQIFDVGSQNNPLLIGNAALIGKPISVKAHDNYVYVATGFGLEVVKAVPQASQLN